jgi:AcrR family transcriptional regulator
MNPDSSSRRAVQGSLRERLRREVADAILAAAEAEMAEKGVQAAALTDIAARAGVAVGTVYNHFEDRKALVQALFRARRQEIAPKLRLALVRSEGLPFVERLERFVRDTLALYEERRAFLRVAIDAEHLKPRDLAPGSNRPIMNVLQECLSDLLRAGMSQGALAEADLELRVAMLSAMMRAAVQRALAHDHPFGADGDALVDLFLHGAAARP